MEGASDVAVIPVDIGWSDVGSWASLLDIIPPNESGNVIISGEHLPLDTSGTLIQASKLVATIGLRDMIIIDTEDALLICPRDRSQEVKKIVERLQKKYL
jgi:mannose-1-phosphate guanylyltransferase